jgi:hypothetical protein
VLLFVMLLTVGLLPLVLVLLVVVLVLVPASCCFSALLSALSCVSRSHQIGICSHYDRRQTRSRSCHHRSHHHSTNPTRPF